MFFILFLVYTDYFIEFGELWRI